MFSLQQNWRKGQNRFFLEVRRGWGRWEGEGGKVAYTMYTHMNKCINNKKHTMEKRQSVQQMLLEKLNILI
jgi:hypothetical protein